MTKEIVKFEETSLIRKSNEFIKGRYDLTLQEQRFILLIMSLIKPNEKDFDNYIITVKDIANMLEIDIDSMRRDLKAMSKKLMSKVIEINYSNMPNKEEWRMFHWIESFYYKGETGEVSVRISNELKPFLLELKSKYTQYQLREVMKLTSKYALALYEIAKMNDYKTDNKFIMSIDELRTIMKCESKFALVKDFRIRVIETAIREINDKTDIELSVEYIKRGKKILAVEFEVCVNHKTFKERQEERERQIREVQQQLDENQLSLL